MSRFQQWLVLACCVGIAGCRSPTANLSKYSLMPWRGSGPSHFSSSETPSLPEQDRDLATQVQPTSSNAEVSAAVIVPKVAESPTAPANTPHALNPAKPTPSSLSQPKDPSKASAPMRRDDVAQGKATPRADAETKVERTEPSPHPQSTPGSAEPSKPASKGSTTEPLHASESNPAAGRPLAAQDSKGSPPSQPTVGAAKTENNSHPQPAAQNSPTPAHADGTPQSLPNPIKLNPDHHSGPGELRDNKAGASQSDPQKSLTRPNHPVEIAPVSSSTQPNLTKTNPEENLTQTTRQSPNTKRENESIAVPGSRNGLAGASSPLSLNPLLVETGSNPPLHAPSIPGSENVANAGPTVTPIHVAAPDSNDRRSAPERGSLALPQQLVTDAPRVGNNPLALPAGAGLSPVVTAKPTDSPEFPTRQNRSADGSLVPQSIQLDRTDRSPERVSPPPIQFPASVARQADDQFKSAQLQPSLPLPGTRDSRGKITPPAFNVPDRAQGAGEVGSVASLGHISAANSVIEKPAAGSIKLSNGVADSRHGQTQNPNPLASSDSSRVAAVNPTSHAGLFAPAAPYAESPAGNNSNPLSPSPAPKVASKGAPSELFRVNSTTAVATPTVPGQPVPRLPASPAANNRPDTIPLLSAVPLSVGATPYYSPDIANAFTPIVLERWLDTTTAEMQWRESAVIKQAAGKRANEEIRDHWRRSFYEFLLGGTAESSK